MAYSSLLILLSAWKPHWHFESGPATLWQNCPSDFSHRAAIDQGRQNTGRGQSIDTVVTTHIKLADIPFTTIISERAAHSKVDPLDALQSALLQASSIDILRGILELYCNDIMVDHIEGSFSAQWKALRFC